MLNKEIPEDLYFGTGTIRDFNIGKFFEEYVFQKNYHPYQFDGWNERKHYGLKDSYNNIIYPKQEYLKIYTNNLGVSQKNIFFVTEAFLEMKNYTQELLKKNLIDHRASIYLNLNAAETTVNGPDAYLEYLNNIYNIFVNKYLRQEIINNIKDIHSFIPYFIEFIKIMAPIAPITRQNYYKSKFVSPNINGLTISLESNLRTDNIKEKANKFISNTYFENFVDTAGRFGFFVDRNAPWKIVADLTSPAMKAYYLKYNLLDLNDIFDKLYFKAIYSELKTYRNVLINFWNGFASNIGQNVTQDYREGCKNLFSKTTVLNQTDETQFEKIYNIDWQIRIYLYTRIFESNLLVTQTKFEWLCEEASKINKYHNTDSALEFIELKISELENIGDTTNLTSDEKILRLISSSYTSKNTSQIIF